MRVHRPCMRTAGKFHGTLRKPNRSQGGVSLVVSLLMLIAVMLLGLSATQIALQGEKASRNDRDRQIAFQAAEAALLDAEMDIDKSPDSKRSRSAIFSRHNTFAFVEGCGQGEGNPYLGLCAQDTEGAPPWLLVDFLNRTSSAVSVPLGKFTGQTFQIGKGSLPARLPRYIIELMPYNAPGEGAEQATQNYFYRVTSIGFGVRETTLVVLQSIYRKSN